LGLLALTQLTFLVFNFMAAVFFVWGVVDMDGQVSHTYSYDEVIHWNKVLFHLQSIARVAELLL